MSCHTVRLIRVYGERSNQFGLGIDSMQRRA